jgi:hypothetical protein
MPFYIIVIIISFFASLIGLSVKENRIPVLISFSFFLLLTAAVEYTGWKLSMKYINTIALYNFFTLFEFIFYLLFFRAVFSSSRMKKTILAAIIAYFVCCVLNIFFVQKGIFNSYTYVLGCILIVIFSIVYFYFLFRFPETGSLIKNPFFWIGIGLLFYYTCTIPVYGMQNFITITVQHYNWILTFIEDVLNIMLYSLFSIGFLCKVNFRKLLGLL